MSALDAYFLYRKGVISINPIEYLLKQGFRKTSDPNTYASGIFGKRDYTVNGYNYDSYCDGYHNAYDFAKVDGAAIPSIADGGVVTSGTSEHSNFGTQVVVAYPKLDIQVIYGHLKKGLKVKIGDIVDQGDTIGYQGATNYNNVYMASHLHIQFQKLGYIPDERTFVCTGIDVLNIDVNKKAAPAPTNSDAMIIDLSHHQPSKSINYKELSKYVDHAIIRTMDADMIDREYETHHKRFKEQGVPTAAYAFVRGQNDTHMINEAKMFWERTKDLDPTFWWLDVEADTHPDMRHGVSVYLNEMRRLGAKKVGLYIAHHLYKQLNLDVSEADAVWIPHYGSGSATADSKPSFPADIHQYTEHGRLPGYNSNLDLNRIISDKKLEYFTDGKASKKKPVAAPPVKVGGAIATSDTSTYIIKPGDTLSGIAQMFSTTTEKLQSLNGIKNANDIVAGATIKVTGGVAGGGSTSAYTIQPGDTLSGIASKYGTTAAAIQSANNIPNANKIYAGQVIRIPGGGTSTTYTVQSGDTLSHIASRYNTTASALQKLNGISNKDVIYAGQKLKVKGATKKVSKPKVQYHTVQSGDNVSYLASKYGSSQSQIVKWNKLASADKIFIGQKLRVK